MSHFAHSFPHQCSRCINDWTTRPNTQFDDGNTTLAIVVLNLNGDMMDCRLCNECFAHYSYAVVEHNGYIDDEEEDDDEEEQEDEDPSSSDDTDYENDIVCCDPE